MPNFKLILEYDGTDFSGWQVQKGGRTVQGELESALRTMLGGKVNAIAAGRTDAGVHALGQVANFSAETETPAENIRRGLNGILPRDVRVLDCSIVPPNFHSRFDAVWRMYMYRISLKPTAIYRHTVSYVRFPLRIRNMDGAAETVLGEHDFNSFCKTNTETENKICRIMESRWTREFDLLVYRVKANRFLHHMVRVLVGTMLEVGRGKMSLQEFVSLLGTGDRRTAGQTAEAKGLFLERVEYPANAN